MQAPGMDYQDTFAPVTKLTSNRIVLTLAAWNDWEVNQMDVKNTYLNADLDEVIFMAQPPRFTQASKDQMVCRFFKALYGLKQAGHCWYHHMCLTFKGFGYTKCKMEPCIFYRQVDEGVVIIVITIDDLTLTTSN